MSQPSSSNVLFDAFYMPLYSLQSLLNVQLVMKELFQSSTQFYIDPLDFKLIGPVQHTSCLSLVWTIVARNQAYIWQDAYATVMLCL